MSNAGTEVVESGELNPLTGKQGTSSFGNFPVYVPPIRLRQYQERPADEIVRAVLRGDREILVAACQGFGKTEVAIEVIRRLVSYGHASRVLVLAHGMTVLRDNFENRLKKIAPGLTERVSVKIPQQWKSIDGGFDLVVVDEAHHFYEVDGGLVERLIESTGAKQVLLLTATPSVFIARGLKPAVVFSLKELQAEDGGRWVHDIRIDLATCAYEVKKDDWNAQGEVKQRVKYTRAATEKTLKELFRALSGRVDLWASKTIIACQNKHMARLVSAALTRRKVKHLVSYSGDEGDKNSDEMKAFPNPASPPVLVAVRRGGLGYDMPSLVNFVDLTLSKNPDRIWQMEGRVFRPMNGIEKAFVKVMPAAFSDDALRHYMTGVQMLGERSFLETYDGCLFLATMIPVETSDVAAPVKGEVERRPALASGMRLFGDHFASIEGKAQASSGRVFATARLGDLLGSRVMDPEGRKQAIRDWYDANGALPPRRTTALGRALGQYCSRTKVYDQEFHRWATERGYRSWGYLIEINGQIMTAGEWGKQAGLSWKVVWQRHRRGIRGAELLLPKMCRRTVVVDGATLSLRRLADEVGLPCSAVVSRYDRGLRGDALVAPLQRKGRKKVLDTLINGALATREISALVGQVPGTVRAVLRRLTREGRVHRAGCGASAKWSLTADAPHARDMHDASSADCPQEDK